MILKYVLPWGAFTIVSAESAEMIAASLRGITGPAHELMGPDDISGKSYVFVGTVEDRQFRLSTPLEDFSLVGFARTRNICRPVLNGRIHPAAEGCVITVGVRMQVFSYILLTGLMLTLLTGAIFAYAEQKAAIPVICAVIVVSFCNGFFWFMVHKARMLLIAAVT